jgi:integrase
LVFTREDGVMLSPLWLSKQFARLVTAAGLPKIRLHGLRHSHASMARDAGVPVEVLSRRLGHSRTSTTSDLYVTTHRSRDREAAEAVSVAIFGR